MPYIRKGRRGIGQTSSPCGWFDWIWTSDACLQYLGANDPTDPRYIANTQGFNAGAGTLLGTCTTDPTAPIGSQCASIAGAAQTATSGAASIIGDAVTGAIQGLNPANPSNNSTGSVLLIGALIIGGVYLVSQFSGAPSGRRRR